MTLNDDYNFARCCRDVSDAVTRFLFENQCILKYINLENAIGMQKLRFTRGGPNFDVGFSVSEGKLDWQCGENSGSVVAGANFRINPFRQSVKQCELELPKVKKTSRLGRLFCHSTQLWRHFRQAGLDFDTRCLISEIRSNLMDRSRDLGGGFLARWEPDESVAGRVILLDWGGILDDNPNVEGAALPPRVMANYYADAYAAFLFLRQYLDTKEPEWLDASLASLLFIANTYENYPRGVTWYHHEFKNPAVLECILVMQANGIAVPAPVQDLVKRMHIDSYEPTNVFALRIYWKGLQGKMTGNADLARIRACRERLQRDTTGSGLILDENPPAYIGARDLTYHQYSLACLAGYLTHCEDQSIKELFLKGCQFTLQTRLLNGEVSYNGRGANNIYHVAAALYALAFASYRYGLEVGDLRPMLNLLQQWLGKGGALPTGMNAYPEERMGWNHCRTPYNALTAYYLRMTEDYLGQADFDSQQREQPLTQLVDLSDSGYLLYQNSSYTWVLFAGVRESYIYSNANQTGISGSAVISPQGHEPINLILNRSWRRPATLATDFPTVYIDGKGFAPSGGDLGMSGRVARWSKKIPEFTLLRTFEFDDSGVAIEVLLKVHVSCRLAVNRWIALPIHTDRYGFQVSEGEIIIYTKNRASTKVAVLVIDSDVLTREWSQEPVISNPRGRGVIIKRNISERLCNAGTEFRSTWRLQFNGKE